MFCIRLGFRGLGDRRLNLVYGFRVWRFVDFFYGFLLCPRAKNSPRVLF